MSRDLGSQRLGSVLSTQRGLARQPHVFGERCIAMLCMAVRPWNVTSPSSPDDDLHMGYQR